MFSPEPHRRVKRPAVVLACALLCVACANASAAPSTTGGWLSWRGPSQSGVSSEARPPVKLGKPTWSHDLRGRGSPVVAVVGGKARVYAVGFRGEGAALREFIVALDATTGKLLWQHGESDFLSDTIYERYGIGAPAIDAETGAVYAQTANGLLTAFDDRGKILWQRSMMEELGRLTFPNARTGGPVIDGDLVIARGITANWGAQGAPRDRLYAFEKRSGALVWASTPGDAPKDNSFSTPVFGWEGGRRVLFVGTG